MFPGRTKEQKKSVIKEVTKELHEQVGITPADVFIVLHDPPLENWGFSGEQKEG